MQYYHNIITEKSFKFLQELKKQFKFILIGGWAVFLYTRSLKSKDIDIIVDYSELAKMKEKFDVFKNERLKKYEIKTGEFDIDIYLPNYSDLGLKIEEIKNSAIIKEGFSAPLPEILFLLKLRAWQERRGSPKGQKDELDIFSLIILPEFNWEKLKDSIDRFNFSAEKEFFKNLLKNTTSVKELGLNEQKLSKIKKSILAKI